jgi:hypothetical protein
MAIHRADRVLRVKIGVDYLFLPFINSIVLRMNVLAQLIDGPKRNTLRARPMAAQTVSAFFILATSSFLR